jgi:hypothetical protein
VESQREAARRKAVAIAVAAVLAGQPSAKPAVFQPREESAAWRLAGRLRLHQRFGVRR